MKVRNILNQKFGRLLVLDRVPNPGTRKNDTAAYWKCRCDCGKEVVIRGYSLTTGKTKSCGCLNDECSHLDKYKVARLSHAESVAMKLWRRNERYTTVPFQEFIKLIQQPCHYCHQPASMVKYSNRKDSQPFYHGTLDRVDSSLGHTLGNVVACCVICNRAKLDRSLDDFKIYLFNIKKYVRIDYLEYRKIINKMPTIEIDKNNNKNIQVIYNYYKINKPGDLSIKVFYTLSQMSCYYCGTDPCNKRDYYGQKYIYNGLDRVDNNKGHSYDNVVPCCKYCNSAKNNLSLEDFLSWIERIKKL